MTHQRFPSILGLSALLCIFYGCGDDKKQTDIPPNMIDMMTDLSSDMTPDQSQPVDMTGDMVPGEDMSGDMGRIDCSTRAQCLYPANTFTVNVVDGLTITSKDTGRVLPITVRYPMDAVGKRPVVIWSHGGSYNNNGHKHSEDWGNLMSSHGFVVIHLAHVEPTADVFTTLCKLANVEKSECIEGDIMTGERPFVDSAVARPYDIIAVLDALPKMATKLQKDDVEMDMEQVAVTGWSAGSQAGLMLLGATREITPTITSYAVTDSRVKITMGMSPQGPGDVGYTETSFDTIERPVLIMTGNNDEKPGKPELPGTLRRRTFELIKGGMNHHYLLYNHLPVGTGGHNTFNLADVGSEDVDLAHFSEAMTSTALAYLDAYLSGQVRAKKWLDSTAPKQLADNKADWIQK